MLIDIEKYVRQLLPPNRRGQNHVGLIATLFRPLDSVINAQNDFVRDSELIPNGGQVCIMEYVLQNYVNSNIKILDADGVRIDFRVLVPLSLTPGELGQVRQLVERLRLSSKRYEVANIPDWSVGGGTSGLAWEIAPEVISGQLIRFKVNKEGSFHVRIYRLDGTHLYIDQMYDYNAAMTPAFLLPSLGAWKIEVGPLTGTIDLTPVSLVTIAPDWLLWLGITWAHNSRECSLWLDTLANVDVELRIESANGSPISGLTWEGVPFTNAAYIPGTSIWATPHSEVFRLNPAGGSGGLQPGTEYNIFIRRTQAPNQVFTMQITTPTTDVSPALAIVLPTGGTGDVCENPPTVAAVHSYTVERVTYTFGGGGITDIKHHLKNVATSAIVRSALLHVSTKNPDGSYTAVFSPGNRPTWTFPAPVPAGTYQLGIEGGNCDSAISWSAPFEIEEEYIPDPDDPLDPQSGDWAVFPQIVPFPGHMKLQRVATPTGWLYTDLVTKASLGVPSDHNGWYVINGKRVVTDRLVNYPVDIPITSICIRKSFQKPDITDWWQVELVLGGDYSRQYAMQPGNIYSAMAADIFIKQ